MVVSETGAKWSPVAAPLKIAPPAKAGLIPIATAAGKSTGVIVTTVPNDVPVAMPKIALAT